ncbi:hypothetical protein PAXINDRAFT_84767 [Paxillus involutus ATCC 200175]|uniref:Unplaced genomic scaffold PAXINscaffold_62, whole genome shotgun sequence n=1 Tax=Paxillus involutus ATCC 200175 TaxID=664439 RepID=A0A0C9SSI2_PAXIN|nr:hypothetical protein PAXINDRAFT_84767 [Paxillus involutus ATCC 200175]
MPSIIWSTVFDGDVVGNPVEPRNLVVCIDGISNKVARHRARNTNIVELFAKIDLDPEARIPRQQAYYSSGVGTHLKAWHTKLLPGSFLVYVAGLRNVEEIVQDAYSWLAKEYRAEGHIHTGFSRGAYRVQILAGLIYEVGPQAWLHHRGTSHAFCPRKLHAKDIASAFEHTFCWEDMKVHFVGVWDTVLSVGLVKEDVSLSTSSSAEHACHFRHDLALDELEHVQR